MVHYFVVDFGNSGDFYNIGVLGDDKHKIEEYLKEQSQNVRYLKSCERKKKTGKNIGVGIIVSCRYLSRCPKGLAPDTRGTVI